MTLVPNARTLAPVIASSTGMNLRRTICLLVGLTLCAACGRSGPSPSRSQATSPTTEAARLCSSAFGSRYINSAIGTVAEVRTLTVGPGFQPAKDAFSDVPAGQVAAWCWTGAAGAYRLYAVVQGHPPLKVEGLAVANAPGPGPAPIP